MVLNKLLMIAANHQDPLLGTQAQRDVDGPQAI